MALIVLTPFFGTFIFPYLLYLSYSPKEGDIIFQSLSKNSDLVRAIEGVSQSQYSHCGMVVKKNNKWFVNEAYRPVSDTPLLSWIKRGRGYRICVFRLKEMYHDKLPIVIEALDKYQVRLYDSLYRLDDDKIYCSELVYKAFKDATGETLGKLEELRSLNWQPFKKTIIKYENGPAIRKHFSKTKVSNPSLKTNIPTNGLGI